MIRNVHTTTLRELVAQAERDLAGYRRLLDLAEREERVGAVYPDPMTPASVPWAPPQAEAGTDYGSALRIAACACGRPDDTTKTHRYDICSATDDQLRSVLAGRAPYPIDGDALPASHTEALDTLKSEHDAYAQTPKAVREDEKWRQA
jgi:hypothetical protein